MQGWFRKSVPLSLKEDVAVTRCSPCSGISRWFPMVVMGIAVCVSPNSVRAATLPFRLFPEEVHLRGNFARAQLVVTATDKTGATTDRSPDLTSSATYRSSDSKVVTVSKTGQLLATGNGSAKITVTYGKVSRQVPVKVTDVVPQPKIRFSRQIVPLISKAGCNMGACHATQYGKGGFKLSVFGYDPNADYAAIVRDRQQRRLSFLDPAASLLLKKPTMQVPHGGGQRLKKNSVDYRVLRAWIADGAPGPNRKTPKVTDLSVTPKRRVGQTGLTQQLRVVATYSDGGHRDVTTWVRFDSMDESLLHVDQQGFVKTIGKGQAPVMVRFGGLARISMFVVPYADSVRLAGWKNNNFVDRLAADKFRELGVEPSGLCDDATFLRRVFFDAIGTLPSIETTTAFLKSKDPNKRTKLIEQLLGLTGDPKQDVYNDQYAAYWSLKWSDLIRNRSSKVGEQGMWALHNWIRESFRTNKPFDRFATELVTAKGSIYRNGPANYFRINGNTSELAESTAQLFMGIRLQCAKCHHHPFEKYSQADYRGFGDFFARVGTKNSEEFGLFGRESVVIVRQRKTRKPITLDGETVDDPLDLRIPLAHWMTSPKNRYFAQAAVNRYVSYLLGHGLVEPVDDLRETNPPSNVALMEALAKDFVKSGYNLKHLIRTIMVSRLYQLDSQPTAANVRDRRFYSHFKVKRIAAEPLLDAIDTVTGVQTKFKSLPKGTRAIELPDAEYPNYFLTTFGKPKRVTVC